MWSKSIRIIITTTIVCLVHSEIQASEQAVLNCGSVKNKNSVSRQKDDFLKGSRELHAYGSAIGGDQGKGEMYALHLGFGYFFADSLSVNIDFLNAHIRSGIDDNGIAKGLDMLLRKHFHKLHNDLWSVYFETGAGLQQQSTNFSGSRHFNFRLMSGFGGTMKIYEHIRMIGGAKYLHISDAGIRGGGGGFDGVMLFAGAVFPF